MHKPAPVVLESILTVIRRAISKVFNKHIGVPDVTSCVVAHLDWEFHNQSVISLGKTQILVLISLTIRPTALNSPRFFCQRHIQHPSCCIHHRQERHLAREEDHAQKERQAALDLAELFFVFSADFVGDLQRVGGWDEGQELVGEAGKVKVGW